MPLRALFEAPTVAGAGCAHCEGEVGGEQNLAPPIVTVARNQELPLSFAQQRLWFLNQLEPDNPLYNVPIAIGMTGRLHFRALAPCFERNCPAA